MYYKGCSSAILKSTALPFCHHAIPSYELKRTEVDGIVPEPLVKTTSSSTKASCVFRLADGSPTPRLQTT